MKDNRIWTFPDNLAPEVAPLSRTLARHLYHYWLNEHNDLPDQEECLKQFLMDVNEQRENVYFVMDSFVRNRIRDQSPHRLTYSNQWLRETLGKYTPSGKPIPPKTFNHWVSMNLIRNERKGQPTRDSGAALCIMRMSIKGKKVLPHSIPADEPAWWCYAQESPLSPFCVIPITDIPHLPAHTLIWTPWAGAAWDEEGRWWLLSNATGSHFYGAIRFAGATNIHGKLYYHLTYEELITWCPALRAMISSGPYVDDELQAFLRVALVQLAYTRIPPYSMHTSSISFTPRDDEIRHGR
ncbi:hypothetical protein [Dictyobacter formicarum]|uniref:Uncharacterized protein n=1 Tax=Dictyobacter formicarum TaxID=2778368 RepID=A0ABQ3V878_9CHLR|nr:hypothetical protein [Dictyobacter formicarum]GHO82325.1 hypothetical protein KSZ_03310 [Dictyobacter formicarum]